MKLDVRKTEAHRDFIIHTLYYGLIGLLIWLAYRVFRYVSPFVAGFGIVYLLQPQIRRWNRRIRFRRPIGAVCVLSFFYLFLLLSCGLAGGLLFRGAESLLNQLPEWIQTQFFPMLDRVAEKWARWSTQIFPDASAHLDVIRAKIPDWAAAASAKLAAQLTRITSGLPSALIRWATALISSYFFAWDYPRIASFLSRQCPPRIRLPLQAGAAYARATLLRLIQSYGWILLITFSELALGLTLLHVARPIRLAVWIALIDILPVLGIGIVLIPWAGIALLQGAYARGVGLLILFAVISLLRNVLEPRIVGQKTGLSPLLTLICMMLGLWMFGVSGIFLLPIAVITLLHLQDRGLIRLYRKKTQQP